MGLYDALSENNKVYWHWGVPADKTGKDMIREAMTSDLYFASVNGLAETGEIVNIDPALTRRGCAYGVEIPSGECYAAEETLRKKHVGYGEIIR